MKKLLLFILILFTTSCRERVKIIELLSIKVDTTYIYKVEYMDDNKPFISTVEKMQKFQPGEYIIEF